MFFFRKRWIGISLGLTFVSIVIGITLFQHWEMTHETWAYWFFARLLGETGTLPVVDRSPVYVVYLLLFRWLGYPNGVTIEYIVTSLIVAGSIFVFFRPYLGIPLSTLAIILWLPYLQISEPAPQKLALACSLLAIQMRAKGETRQRIMASYALLITSYLLRASYAVVFMLIFAWDSFVSIRAKRVSISEFRPRVKSDWPIIVVVLFFLLVFLRQSPHPWNNVWGATTTWFPSDGKSFMRMLQNYNVSYILQRYGNFDDRDFFFTNKEVFGDARDLVGAYLANPDFMVKTAAAFFRDGLPMVTSLTQLPKILHVPDSSIYQQMLVAVIIFFGAFMVSRGAIHRVFVVGSMGMLILTILHSPKERYMVFLIPIFILSAAGWGQLLWKVLSLAFFVYPAKARQYLRGLMYVATSSMLVFIFSSGPTSANFSGVLLAGWPELLRTVASDFQGGTLSALAFRDISVYFPPVNTSHKKLVSLSEQCNGIISLEYTFLAAFTGFPIERIFDIWEIPPFGNYGDITTPYQGLRPDRINCLFISKNLKYGVGAGTNSAIRYRNYIKPYADYLLSVGAKREAIEGYGEVIILWDTPSRPGLKGL